MEKRVVFTILFFLFLVATLFLASLLTGAHGVALKEIETLFSDGETSMLIINEIRAPRALVALLAGGALGLSGALMQAVLKNPLASPFTLGISQASAFGATFAIIILQSYSKDGSIFLTPLCAFLSALICTFAILFLSRKTILRSESLILSGVAMGALFSAMTMFMQYFASEIDVVASLFWTFGDLSKANLTVSIIIALFLVPTLLYFLFYYWKLDAMMLGSESAKNLGVNVNCVQTMAMVLSSLLSAITVSFLGIIGFIGLIAPHIIRLIIGGGHRYLLVLSTLCGAALLLLADIISRSIMPPIIIPIGILTSFIGAPLFLYLLTKRGK